MTAEEILLSMTSNLSGCASFDEVSRNSSPISLPHFMQSQQKQFVFFFRPRHTSLAVAGACGGMNDVVGGVASCVSGVGFGFVILGEVVHASALPDEGGGGGGAFGEAHAEEHDAVVSSGGGVGACAGVVAVVAAL